MQNRIVFTNQARKELRSIPQRFAYQILLDLWRFVSIGEGDVKALQGFDPPQFRLRVGDYRMIFRRDGDRIVVLHVRHRQDAYR